MRLPKSDKNIGAGGWQVDNLFEAADLRITNTHTVNTHPDQWAANSVASGEQLGVRCLGQGSHLSQGIKGGESTGHSLPHLQSLPDLRLELATFGLQV